MPVQLLETVGKNLIYTNAPLTHDRIYHVHTYIGIVGLNHFRVNQE